MIGANKKKSDFATPYTVSNALTKGGAAVKLSALIMGLGNIAHKQIIKGLIFLAIEIGYIMFMVNAGAYYLSMLPSLGWRKQEEVFNKQKQIYEYVQGDNSVLLLLYGVATIAITLLFIYMWAENLRSAYMAECLAKEGKEINSFGKDVKSLFDKNLYKTLMFLPLMGILIFTVLPLLFMIPMAFTNYSTINKHLTLFDWVGLANFKTVLGLGGKIGKTFWRVLGWTIVWAVCATFLCNFLGLILAIVINRKETKCKAFWRTCFVISIAVPQFVSLLVMRQMLQEHGAINNLLMECVHIAHDCVLGNGIIVGNSTKFAGEVTIDDNAIISANVLCHQFCHIGGYVMIQGGCRFSQDIPPFIIAGKEPTKYCGLNLVGLRRRGFSNDLIDLIHNAYRKLYSKGIMAEGLAEIKNTLEITKEIQYIIDFVESSKRGIIR